MKKEDIDQITKTNPFKVPEAYFENFSTQLMSSLPDVVKEEPQEVKLWQKMKPWVYMAAMFIGMTLMIKIFIGDTASMEKGVLASKDLSISEIDEFYAYYQNQFDTQDLHESLFFDEDF
ncbi:hypothetical protein AwDysgo_00730 [Bacteroidales bacterium]|nr:hypothetical protein AwDysgo_00730 [Bacteroidales bacterium]